VSADSAWLSLSPTSGTSTGETDDVAVSVDVSGLSAGTYTATITVTGASPATNSPQTTAVTLTVGGDPEIQLTPDSVFFETTQGSDPSSRDFTVRNSGTGTLSWSALANKTWLTVEPSNGSLAAGEEQTVTLNVSSADLSAGTDTAIVQVSGDGAVNSPQELTAVLEVNMPVLTILGGNGSGQVTSDPVGISCSLNETGSSGTCSAEFSYQDTVYLTAEPSFYEEFVDWSGGCSGTSPTCDVVMSSNQEVTATFSGYPVLELSQQTWSPTVIEGTVSEPLELEVINTNEGTLEWTASAYDDFVYANPTSGSLGPGERDTLEVILDATDLDPVSDTSWIIFNSNAPNTPIELTIGFTIQPSADLLVMKTGEGTVTSDDGRIDCGTDCGETYAAGEEVHLDAIPDYGWRFNEWGGACSSAGTSPSCDLTLLQDTMASATFDSVDVVLTDVFWGSSVPEQSNGIGGTYWCNEMSGILEGYNYESAQVSFFISTDTILDEGEDLLVESHNRWPGAVSGPDICAPTSLTPGEYYVIGVADPDNEIPELNEGNNHGIAGPYTLEYAEFAVWVEITDGQGRVESDPLEIDCPGTCGGTLPYPEANLTAQPAAGWQVETWGGECSGTAGLLCTFPLDQRFDVNFGSAAQVSVAFEPEIVTYDLSDQTSSLSTHALWSLKERTYSCSGSPLGTGRGGYYWPSSEHMCTVGWCTESLCCGYETLGLEIFNFTVESDPSSLSSGTLRVHTTTPDTDSWWGQVGFDVFVNDVNVGSGVSAPRGSEATVELPLSDLSMWVQGQNNIFIVYNGPAGSSQQTQVEWVQVEFN
jgi:hypothetical protein